MFLSALLTDDASEEVIVEADEKPSSPPVPPPQRPPQDVVVIDTEEQNRPEYPVIPPVTGEIRFAFPEIETWPICLILVSFLAQLLVFRTAGEQRRLHLLHLHSLQPQREVTHPVSSHNFHSKRGKKALCFECRNCPAGLLFDADKKVCNWASEVTCRNSGGAGGNSINRHRAAGFKATSRVALNSE